MTFRISKSALSWGGVAVAAILFTLAVPRAAHAVAAALVQVTSTAASPVISQGIENQAAQIVQIECGFAPETSTQNPCFLMPPTGIVPSSPTHYVVPNGQTLVVTAVDILSGSEASSPCMSSAFAYVGNGGAHRQLIGGGSDAKILDCAFRGGNGSLCVSIRDFVLTRNEY
jgi:hypothetical protein